MAHTVDLVSGADDLRRGLSRAFQSGHINFLIGSGASTPAIPIMAGVEQQIAAFLTAGQDEQARLALYNFLAAVQGPTNRLIDGLPNPDDTTALCSYSEFLSLVATLLAERRTNLIPKQATIFTTNYDLFVERASIDYPVLKLNDGFSRVPSLNNRMEFSSRSFFNSTYNTGNLYSYEVEIPSLNLVKLHGSMSWRIDKDNIVFHVERHDLLAAGATAAQVKDFIDGYSVIFPQAAKFRTTVMDRNYYDLLRMYANEMDRENALFVVFGFSFGDEHILDITLRALRNPTLRVMVFAFDSAAVALYQQRFDSHSNVHIVAPAAGNTIRFTDFNALLRQSLPVRGTR
jgi:hypothetical protein